MVLDGKIVLGSVLFILVSLPVGSFRMVEGSSYPHISDGGTKQLFLSRRVVADEEEFNGGVLVDEFGVIEAVVKKESIDPLMLKYDNLQVIDGGNLALMAGIVDAHVHVNEPGRTSWEGFPTATAAAAAGGVTTIVDMPLNSKPPTTSLKNLKIKAAMAKEEIYVDVGFWGGIVPGNEGELQKMLKTGIVGFKCLLTNNDVDEFPYIRKEHLEKLMTALNGTGTVLAFHAELPINSTNNATSPTESSYPHLYETYLAAHPEEMELAAASLIASLLNKTDVHVHIAHVSAAGVIPIIEKAREDRINEGYMGWRGGITADTCNHYLSLSSEEVPPGRTEFKCNPPIRDNTNRQILWDYILEHRLDLIVSDHSPTVESMKGRDFTKAWGGISSLQFDLPLFWTEAKARGYTLNDVSHYLSAGPAQLCGFSRKGVIRPGYEADFIFFDPEASFIVTPEIIRYKNKISPYMYRVLNGKVKETYLRGQLIYADDELVGEPKGELLLDQDDVLMAETAPSSTARPVGGNARRKIYF